MREIEEIIGQLKSILTFIEMDSEREGIVCKYIQNGTIKKTNDKGVIL